MRILISLVSFLLTLVGCNEQPGTTTITFSSVDGVGVNSTKARIGGGTARFECLKSTTGKCNYVVFTRQCSKPDAPGAGNETCHTRVLEKFTLAAGSVRELQGLPASASHCLDPETMPEASTCQDG